MITTAGKGVVKQLFSVQTPTLAHSIALGVGATAAALGDLRLVSEIVRVPIISVSADPSTDQIIYKAIVSPGSIGTVYEAGLYFEDTPVTPGRQINLTDPFVDWTNATVVSGSGRAGTTTVKVDFSASGTTNAEQTGLLEDLSEYTSTDNVVLGFTATSNLSSLRIRLGTDSSNYYEFVATGPTVGYNIYRFNISAATTTGAPDWSNVTYLAVRPSGTAGGSGSVNIDSLRFELAPAASSSILVARYVLATPKVMDTVIDTEIEYALEVSV